MVFGDETGVVFAEDVGVVFAEEVGVVLRAGFVECCFVLRVTAGGRICRWRQCVCTVMHCYTTFVYIRAHSFDMHFTMYVHTCSILQRFLYMYVHTERQVKVTAKKLSFKHYTHSTHNTVFISLTSSLQVLGVVVDGVLVLVHELLAI